MNYSIMKFKINPVTLRDCKPEILIVIAQNMGSPITGEVSDTLIFAKYDLNNLTNLVVTWDKSE